MPTVHWWIGEGTGHGKITCVISSKDMLMEYRRKIYQLYDTEQPEKRWLKEAIQRFRNETLATPKDDSPLAPLFEDTTTPMGARRRAAKICGIHPIDFQEEDGLRQDQNSAFCPVCTKAFTPGNTTDSTVVHLNCHHLVHLKCIFEYWDAPGRYLHSVSTSFQGPQSFP